MTTNEVDLLLMENSLLMDANRRLHTTINDKVQCVTDSVSNFELLSTFDNKSDNLNQSQSVDKLIELRTTSRSKNENLRSFLRFLDTDREEERERKRKRHTKIASRYNKLFDRKKRKRSELNDVDVYNINNNKINFDKIADTYRRHTWDSVRSDLKTGPSQKAFHNLLIAAYEGYPSAPIEIYLLYKKKLIPKDLDSEIWWRHRAISILPQLRIAMNMNISDAYYSFGLYISHNLFMNGHPREVFDNHEIAARLGHPSALYELGMIYYMGYGVIKDEVKAFSYFKKSTEEGYLLAGHMVGTCYENGTGVDQNFDTALECYKTASEYGVEQAQLRLGTLYQFGKYVVQDYNKAVKYYRLAANNGCSVSQCFMGNLYHYGHGVEQSYKKASLYYKLSAKYDNEYAHFNLGNCYLNGRGVEHDYKQALMCYTKAADQGNPMSMCVLGNLYMNGQGVPQSHETAFQHYRMSSEQGFSEGHFKVGQCYYNGLGIDKDHEKAFQHYRMSSDQGFIDGHFMVGQCYYNGLGIDKNHEQAFKHYRISSDLGFIEGHFMVGQCYYNGWGTCKNLIEADKYYKMAIKGGHMECHYILGYRMFTVWSENGTPENDPNFNEALNYLNIAGSQGCNASLFLLCEIYFEGIGVQRDLKRVFSMANTLVKRGECLGRNILSVCFFYGHGVDKDQEEAIKYAPNTKEEKKLPSFMHGKVNDYIKWIEKKRKSKPEVYETFMK